MDDLNHDDPSGARSSVERLSLGDESSGTEPLGVLLDEGTEERLLVVPKVDGMQVGSGRGGGGDGRDGRGEPAHAREEEGGAVVWSGSLGER